MEAFGHGRTCICKKDYSAWVVPTRRRRNTKLEIFTKGKKYPYEKLDNGTIVVYGDNYSKTKIKSDVAVEELELVLIPWLKLILKQK